MSSQRTPDDTWDITSSVGMTAVMVAGARAAENDLLDPLVRDPYAKLLVDEAGVTNWTNMLDEEVLAEVERIDPETAMLLVHSRNYQAVRTHFFDAFFASATAAGIRQAVNLASGLDTRAYRLHWPTGTHIFELDQPKVLNYKLSTLAGHGVQPLTTLHGVGIDLRSDWPTALKAKGFDTDQPTAWLAEGLLAYLPGDAQNRLFDHITALSAPGSRVAAETVGGGQADEQRADLKGRFRNVSQQLGITTRVNVGGLAYHQPDRADLAEWLNGHGWRVNTIRSRDEMERLGRWVGVSIADANDACLSFVVAQRP